MGHALTFKVLTDDTQKVICRSRLRLAKDHAENNLKLDQIAPAEVRDRVFLRSIREPDQSKLTTIDMTTDPFTIDRHDPDADGQVSGEQPNGEHDNGEQNPEEPQNGEPLDVPSPSPPEMTQDEIDDYVQDIDDAVDNRNRQQQQQTRSSKNRVTNRRVPPSPPTDEPATVETVTEDNESPVHSPVTQTPHKRPAARTSSKRTTTDNTSSGPTRMRSANQEAIQPDDDLLSPDNTPRVSLRDIPEVSTVDNEEDLADHLKRLRQPGEPNPKQDPLNLRDMLMEPNKVNTKDIPPDQLPGRTFLMPPLEDGTRHRARILERISLTKEQKEKDPKLIKFRAIINEETPDIVAYNDIISHIEDDESWEGIWKFRKITGHQGPLRPSHPNHKGSSWNLKILWEDGSETWEPLHGDGKDGRNLGFIKQDAPSVAAYAKDNNLMGLRGWRVPELRRINKTQKRMIRSINQAKLHSFRTAPVYMYGVQVPRNHAQAMELDRANGNTRWADAEVLELKQVDEYETFTDKGKEYRPPDDYKKITVHFVYACKHDGRHKARLVAGGHLTDTPIDSVYSSVVSLRGIRILAFIAELQGSEFWGTDIGNAYLESYTQEKVYIRAGPEFRERHGHILIISRALYGLKSSGLRWHERLADVLRSMGFYASKAERDIWMRDMGDHYEYIAVYVDDLAIVSRDAKKITDILTEEHNFKLKGTGAISFHLGCDFYRDGDNVLCYAPKKYIIKLLDNFERLFGQKPKQYKSPLEKGDNPELDTSELLDIDGIKIYQSLIGSLQWIVQIGRFDVHTAVMSMSRFRAAPRQGHLQRAKRIFGYLSKMRHSNIRIRVEMPDFSNIPEKTYDWSNTCYRGAKEDIPDDAPIAKGNPVLLSSYVDANLYHDLLSGKSVTGILHFANKTPLDWFSKLQGTVETATFGSEFVAARTCTEQAIDLRTTFRYLGVPIAGQHMMFGDNESVVNSSVTPHSKLHKRHTALSYHKTRDAIAAGWLRFHHIPGEINPADILSKHWDYATIWPILQPILFYAGDTTKLLPQPGSAETAAAQEKVES